MNVSCFPLICTSLIHSTVELGRDDCEIHVSDAMTSACS